MFFVSFVSSPGVLSKPLTVKAEGSLRTRREDTEDTKKVVCTLDAKIRGKSS